MVTVKDLKNQIGKRGPHPVLHCTVCGEDNSANSGDYFMTPDDYVFRHCGEPMVLATRHVVYRPVIIENKNSKENRS